MSGPELAREMALLGAECMTLVPSDEVIDAHRGYPVEIERWRALRDRMRAHFEAQRDSRLVALHGLTELSYWLVQLCVAVELYPDAAAAVSLVAEDERVSIVTPNVFAQLARAALELPFEDALAAAIPGGQAERLGMVERALPAANKPLTQQPLRLSPAELAVELGADPLLETNSMTMRCEPPANVTAFDASLVAGAEALLEEHGVLCIRAISARVGRQFAIDIASRRRELALLVSAGEEAPNPVEIGRLHGGLCIVDLFSNINARGFSEALVRRLAMHKSPLIVVVPASASTLDLVTVDIEALTFQERQRVWALSLGDDPKAAGLASRFGVNLEEARSALRAARTTLRLRGAEIEEPDESAIAAEVMAQGARRMGRLVTRLRAQARLSDLVVPPPLRLALDDVISWYRVSTRVADERRLASRSPLGRGLTCLFAGAPGTGKTFAAQCLAKELGLNLYRIDLSQVVSKYIGETEKALSQVFEEAEAGHGILLFDEADALFGKRSEVKDARDRYANIEVSYLLQRFEAYDGISILTTNLASHIDPAFVRRLSFVLEFPMPDAAARRRLWEEALPVRSRWAPGLDIDFFVERLPLSGGNIHNIGRAAAHIAAAQKDGALSVEHLVRVTYRELEKNGMARSRDTFGPLAIYLPKRV